MFVIIDRGISFGMEGFLAQEIKASLYKQKDPPLVVGFIGGLGGRDVTFKTIEKIANKSLKWMHKGKIEKDPVWVDLKE
jgi:pyruvate ferredoxin oxidoreductase alpha subunit